MDVILIKSVENLGDMGDTVSVAPGYARNYLIPQGLAVVDGEGARNVVAQQMRLEAKRDLARKESAEILAREIGTLRCTIPVQADEEEKLFGSVTARDIAGAVSTDSLPIEHRMVDLPEPIKLLGTYTVPVKLHNEVQVEAEVQVVRA